MASCQEGQAYSERGMVSKTTSKKMLTNPTDTRIAFSSRGAYATPLAVL